MNELDKLREIAQARCPTCQLEALGGWDAFNKPHTHPADLKQMQAALLWVFNQRHTNKHVPSEDCPICTLIRTEIMALTRGRE